MNDTERANRVLERAALDPKIQQVIADARLYDTLRENPAWRRLYEMVAAKKERWMRDITDRLMRKKSEWPEAEEIAYHRGFYEGAFFVLVHPEVAEANLEKAAKIAWRLYGDDDTEEVFE
jgi:hypothetical protein